jgi:hypothetical protein
MRINHRIALLVITMAVAAPACGRGSSSLDAGSAEPASSGASTTATTATTAVAPTATATPTPAAPVATTAPPRAEALSAASRLRIDGIGPIEIGMTVKEAQAAAGVPLTVTDGPFCRTLRAPGGPDGVALLVTANSGDRITVVTVSTPAVSTVSGVHVGSTEADVLAAYPGQLVVRGEDPLRSLVYHARDPNLSRLSVVFLIRDSAVRSIQAGVRDIVEGDEICA